MAELWSRFTASPMVRSIQNFGNRVLQPILSALLLFQRSSGIPFSSFLLYLEAAMILISPTRNPIQKFWYGTRLDGGGSLLGFCGDYIITPLSICSLFVAVARANDPIKKEILVLFHLVVALWFSVRGLYFQSIPGGAEWMSREHGSAKEFEDIFLMVHSFFLHSANINSWVLRLEERLEKQMWVSPDEKFRDILEQVLRLAHELGYSSPEEPFESSHAKLSLVGYVSITTQNPIFDIAQMALAAVRNLSFSPRGQLAHRAVLMSSPRHAHQQRNYGVYLPSYLVTPKELHEAMKRNVPTKISTSPRIIPLCASWFMPNDPEGRTGLEVFKKKHIPHARFFDIDAVKDEESPYPHMLPTRERFAEAMRDLGIRRDDEIVVYDTEELGIFSAPRVGWTLRVFGHPNIHVLDNFKLWVREGYPTESGEPQIEKSDYSLPDYDADMVVQFGEMKEIAEDYGKEGAEGIQVLDARPAGRWAGTDPEPRASLSSGHMPGSISLPFPELLDPETKTFLPATELRKIFESKGIDPATTTVSSCGSGVTAAVIETALGEAGYTDRKLYDGSWT
ncbi:hypothetical protein FQN54_003884 [Arachnomyces sp. PD_36]|nr:hypothetical protein FQN54_003884 [Arachnomyces sp. PD_36]